MRFKEPIDLRDLEKEWMDLDEAGRIQSLRQRLADEEEASEKEIQEAVASIWHDIESQKRRGREREEVYLHWVLDDGVLVIAKVNDLRDYSTRFIRRVMEIFNRSAPKVFRDFAEVALEDDRMDIAVALASGYLLGFSDETWEKLLAYRRDVLARHGITLDEDE